MITIDDLKKNAQFRGVMFLDMDRGGYQNHYQSTTYPRLKVVKEGSPRVGKKQKYLTTYYVDDVECGTLEIVVARLNAAPFKSGPGGPGDRQGNDALHADGSLPEAARGNAAAPGGRKADPPDTAEDA